MKNSMAYYLLKKAPRCDDSVSESLQVSQERPINITRVSETRRRTSWERRKDQGRSRLTVHSKLKMGMESIRESRLATS